MKLLAFKIELLGETMSNEQIIEAMNLQDKKDLTAPSGMLIKNRNNTSEWCKFIPNLTVEGFGDRYDKQIIEAMNADNKIKKKEMLQDELHERNMRTDLDYFLEHNDFDKLKEDYDRLYKKMWDYGYYDKLKDYL